MTIQTQINKLEAELKVLKVAQKNCQHIWYKPIYNPKDSYESYDTGEYERNGIHSHPIMDSRSIKIDRWSRTCSNCGLIQYTEKQTAVKVEMAPDFR